MTSTPSLLRPAEAAVVAAVSIRDVNRAIDETIVPERFVRRDGGRRLDWRACTLIAFYHATERDLGAELRRAAVQAFARELENGLEAAFEPDRARAFLVSEHASASSTTRLCYRERNITVDAASFFTGAVSRLDDLRAAQALVSRDPEILGGVPVLRGTRVPVRTLAAMLDEGIAADRIAELYPGLDARHITLAGLWARANPARGRPPVAKVRSRDDAAVRRVRRTSA